MARSSCGSPCSSCRAACCACAGRLRPPVCSTRVPSAGLKQQLPANAGAVVVGSSSARQHQPYLSSCSWCGAVRGGASPPAHDLGALLHCCCRELPLKSSAHLRHGTALGVLPLQRAACWLACQCMPSVRRCNRCSQAGSTAHLLLAQCAGSGCRQHALAARWPLHRAALLPAQCTDDAACACRDSCFACMQTPCSLCVCQWQVHEHKPTSAAAACSRRASCWCSLLSRSLSTASPSLR